MPRVNADLAKSLIEKSRRLSAGESFEGHVPTSADALAAIFKMKAVAVTYDDRMNGEERAFAQQCAIDAAEGRIVRSWFQPCALLLAHDCRYTPDYLILHNDRSMEFVDVKAWWAPSKKKLREDPGAKGRLGVEEDARIKIKAAARLLPVFAWSFAWRVNGIWNREEVKP